MRNWWLATARSSSGTKASLDRATGVPSGAGDLRVERLATSVRIPRMHVGFIGAGGITDTHIRAARSVPGRRDRRRVSAAIPTKTVRLAREHGAVAYDDLERFLAIGRWTSWRSAARRACTASRASPPRGTAARARRKAAGDHDRNAPTRYRRGRRGGRPARRLLPGSAAAGGA